MTHARKSTTRINVALMLSSTAVAAVLIGGQPSASISADTTERVSMTSDSLADMRSKVRRLTNKARNCKDDLVRNTALTKSAQGHANDMAANNYFSHTSQNGRSWDRRIRNAGHDDPGGENIAYGFASPERVVQEWLDSPPHRRNIMDCDFNYLGVGYNSDGHFWVQDFGY